MYSDFFNSLKKQLQKELPGLTAQLKMAPSIRPISDSEISRINAAVLILLYIKEEKINLAFIKRSEYDGPHSGQISLPGGKYKESDKTFIHTAIRESEEEIGINSDDIEILGQLTPLQIPISKYYVQPVIGRYKIEPIFTPDKLEVDYVIEINLDDLSNIENCKTEQFNFKHLQFEAPVYKCNNHIIWGATAMILSEFLEVIKQIKQE
ncbi:MAG: hypothetical protein A2041_03240 [Bacteroidetes bacterium GWA2_31_9b]|nr:MAG: hypothetical protein A2041_03240 [Bacteroidetes bacterium GWA2_31_9b]